ncbi:hypothetical protein BKA66DRAFT_548738 [Pyrenochaeta sp. MPI-SDFR-AT-0127]|nr:hypothetical protein BKA66DRAFT_548738 [Pyrenochaeta sp. MPI-SDFR-AT-0127]
MRFTFTLNPFTQSAEVLPNLPRPLEKYLRSTPFLPVAHLLGNIIWPAAACGSGIPTLVALEAFHSFLDSRSGNALARKLLFCSAFWTMAILINNNTKGVSTFPWFRSSSLAERQIFVVNIFAVLVMMAELLTKVSARDPRRSVETERRHALEWFYSSPNNAAERLRNGALSFAVCSTLLRSDCGGYITESEHQPL